MQKNSKNLKTTFRCYFQQERDEIGRERDKKIFDPNSAHTRSRGENCKKKNCKKIQKIKKQLPGITFSQNGIRLDEIGQERGKEILLPNAVYTLPGQENYEKNSKKI